MVEVAGGETGGGRWGIQGSGGSKAEGKKERTHRESRVRWLAALSGWSALSLLRVRGLTIPP